MLFCRYFVSFSKVLKSSSTFLIRKRSLVRVQAGPPEKSPYLSDKLGTNANRRRKFRPFLTPTRHQRGEFLGQRVVYGGECYFHSTSGVVANTRHDVGVHVQGYHYGGVSR